MTAIHELYHYAEGTKQSAELSKALREFGESFKDITDAATDGGDLIIDDLNKYKNDKLNAAQQNYVWNTEIDADILGKLLGSEKYVTRLAVRNESLVKKLYAQLKFARDNTKSKQARRALNKLTDKFGKAIDNARGGVLISSIREDEEKENTVTRINEENMQVTAEDNAENVRYSKSKSFAEQVDDVLNGADTSNSHLKVMDTPQLLQKAGLPNLPILITAKHIKTITSYSGDSEANYHGLDAEIVKKLPEYISSPVMIADSLTRDDSIVIITEALDSNNNPVIAAIMLNGTGRLDNKFIDANIMTSAYGKNNFQSFINRIADRDSVIYWNRKKSQNLSVNLGVQFPDVITNLDSDIIIRQTRANVNSNSTQKSEKDASNSKKSSSGINDRKSIAQNKQRQFEIIQKTNPMWDDYHVGIRTAEDIRTWAEVLELNDESEGQFIWGDFSRADAEQVLKDGTITVYSSYPIKNGVFVSTSYVQAQEYAGGRNGKVYSKTIPLTDVAWINGDEGQYASVENTDIRYSKTGSSRTNNQDTLEDRVSGDELLDAQDLIEVVKEKGGEVDENGYITLYHRTSAENAEKIRSTGYMKSKEDGLFFSTAKEGYASGYGDTVVEFSVPAEKLILDDIFDNEAHLRFPLKQAGMKNVKPYLITESAVDKNTESDIIEEKRNNTDGGIQNGTERQKADDNRESNSVYQGKSRGAQENDGNRSEIQRIVEEKGGSLQKDESLRGLYQGIDNSWFLDSSHHITPEQSSNLYEVQSELAKEYGVECHIVEKSAWKKEAKAFTTPEAQVYVAEDIDADNLKSISSHEGTHVMKTLNFAPYLEFIDRTPQMLNMSSKEAQVLVGMILKHIGYDVQNLNEKSIKRLYDELNASVYGWTISGIVFDSEFGLEWVPNAFNDFARYINELRSIHEQFKSYNKSQKSDINERSSKTGRDTVEMSKGEIAKFRANYTSDKVFNKRKISEALNDISLISKLPANVRNDLVQSLWKGFNEHRAYDIYSKVMTEQIYATVMQETGFELEGLDTKDSKDATKQLKNEIALALLTNWKNDDIILVDFNMLKEKFMTKKINIKLTSERYASNESFFNDNIVGEDPFDDGEQEEDGGKIELYSEGELKVDGKRAVISYDESELTGMEGSRTEVGFDLDRPGLITMMRSGSVSTVLVFERGERHICTYQTEFMPFEICVNTKDVKNTLLEDGRIYLDYIVEIRGAQAERTVFTVEITESKGISDKE